MGRKRNTTPEPPKARTWPAAEVIMRPVAELVPYARNARTHSARQVEQLVASIQRFGWTNPVLVDEQGRVIAGHGRLLAADKLGAERVPVMVARGWSEEEKRAYTIADNQLAMNAGWDMEVLGEEVRGLELVDFPLDLLGFDKTTLKGMLESEDDKGLGDADRFTVVKDAAVTKRGDVWLLDQHRVLCGDSTLSDDVGALMRDDVADLVHADPPYGMGKEAEGVLNDNLRKAKLDRFQVEWVTLALRHAAKNCGLYVWGNAEDLWRLWYAGGLDKLDELMVRNEIVWAKGSGFGMASDEMHSYPPETERCLFLMRGHQFLGNQNKDDYWEGYEPLRKWMVEQREAAGWKVSDVNRVTGTKMAGHWFGQSQFQVINAENYEKLRVAAAGKAFAMPFADFRRHFEGLGTMDGASEHRGKLSEQLRVSRTYFDNSHDTMTDVWHFSRVVGEERYGHATPKPVAMLARAVVSSCPEDGLVFEPFLGTGSTLIAAHLMKRRCIGMELEPRYVDVVLRRWAEKTGKEATLEATGATFSAVAHERGNQ